MKNLHTLLIVGASLVILEFLVGSCLLVYGVTYKNLEVERAEEMLDFIKTRNPVYYERLASRDDQSYRKEFYNYFTKKGNALFILSGVVLMFLALNSTIPMISISFIHEGSREQKPEIKQQKEEQKPEEEIKRNGIS